jgi:tRNA (guanine-N7-)-methyltransferase
MRLKSKPWAKPLIAQYAHRVTDDEHAFSFGEHQGPFALEIGMGKGDFIVGKAKRDSSHFFFGVERATTVFAFALKKVIEQNLNNVHLLHGDFSKFSLTMPDNFFSTIYLNFSDPWPKIRHHKRRLTARGNLEKITRVLKEHGHIILKTDNLELFDFTLKNLADFPYDILNIQRPYTVIEDDDIETEYERYFRERGEPIYRLIAQKRCLE